jgi:hypothetical protein
MISEASKKDFLDVADETFTQDLQSYLLQRLKDEADQVKVAREELDKAGQEDVPVVGRPVVVRFTFASSEGRLVVKAVGKDFALCTNTQTKIDEKINFSQVVRWRDVSDEANACRS